MTTEGDASERAGVEVSCTRHGRASRKSGAVFLKSALGRVGMNQQMRSAVDQLMFPELRDRLDLMA